MTDDAIIQMLREYHGGLFPKVCPNCGRRFATLREYMLATQPLWPSVSCDVELGDYNTLHPIGSLALANCRCGATLALSTKGMPRSQSHQILEWIRTETVRRGMDPTELLDYVRDEIRRQVLIEPTQRVTSGIDAKLHAQGSATCHQTPTGQGAVNEDLPSSEIDGSARQFSRESAPTRSVSYAPWITPINAARATLGVEPWNTSSAARA